MSDFCVTGLGVISAIGHSVEENLQSLRERRTGIARVSHLDTARRDVLLGEVKRSNEELKHSIANLEPGHYDRTTLLGMIAVGEALKQAKVSSPETAALISSTSVGGMCYTELHYGAFMDEQAHPPFIRTHECAASTFTIAGHFNFKGYTDTISTACSSSANAIMMACNLIQNGHCQMAVAGGTDALSAFTLNGFNTLMILDPEWCRPFDESRAGLNLGEGAAYMVIETEDSARQRGVPVLARISGYANYNDAYHQTASSPEGKGATLAMEKSLDMAGLSPAEITWINAHGTATPNNDQSESTAIRNVFGETWPPFSSTKAFTGHTLAAAGSIEAVYSILALQNSEIYPNLNFRTPIAEFDKRPVTELVTGSLQRHILSNSFGFGGNCSSLVFSRND